MQTLTYVFLGVSGFDGETSLSQRDVRGVLRGSYLGVCPSKRAGARIDGSTTSPTPPLQTQTNTNTPTLTPNQPNHKPGGQHHGQRLSRPPRRALALPARAPRLWDDGCVFKRLLLCCRIHCGWRSLHTHTREHIHTYTLTTPHTVELPLRPRLAYCRLIFAVRLP